MIEQNATNTYELAYLLLPRLSEEEAATHATVLAAMATKTGASEILSNGGPQFIDLEYDMTKRIDSKKERFSQAYFGWVKYSGGAESVLALKEELDITDELLRYMIVKTESNNELTDVFSVEEAVEDVEEILAKTEEESEAEQEKGAKEASEASGEGEKPEGDDLTKVEGVGPVIAKTLTEAGVGTFASLAKATTEEIQEIIKDVRGSHESETWPKQAEMASKGNWEELAKWQDEMDGGREV